MVEILPQHDAYQWPAAVLRYILSSTQIHSTNDDHLQFVCGMIGYFYLLAAPQMATFPSLKWQVGTFKIIGIVKIPYR